MGAGPAAAVAEFCPIPGSVHYYNPPITDGPVFLQIGWFARSKVPPVAEAVKIDAVMSRPDGRISQHMQFDAWSRPDPRDGYEVWAEDWTMYRPTDTGRWKIVAGGTCPDIFYTVVAASHLSAAVPTSYVVAGTTVSVGSTARGWNRWGLRAPVTGMLIDLDRRPDVAGYPWTHAARVRTDGIGRARAAVTVYSNTRFVQNNVMEASSRHDPATLQGPVVYVYKRITRTVSDSTPAVGQAVRISGTVYPARGPAYLQRWNGTAFVTISTAPLATGGKYTFSYRPSTGGSHALRVYTPYDAWHISSASPTAYLTVR